MKIFKFFFISISAAHITFAPEHESVYAGELNTNATWNSYTYCAIDSYSGSNNCIYRPHCSYDALGRLSRCFYIYYWYWYTQPLAAGRTIDFYGYTQALEYYDPVTGHVASNKVCNSGKWSSFGNYPKSRQNGELILQKMGGSCSGDSNIGIPQLCVGNPINPLTGNKFETAVDLANISPTIRRSYNNKSSNYGLFGFNWSSPFDVSIKSIHYSTSPTETSRVAKREDGREIVFVSNDGGATWTPTSDINDVLIKLTDGSGNTTGWEYKPSSSLNTETYDASGDLLSITNKNGVVLFVLEYDIDGKSNTLDRITDYMGNYVEITYTTIDSIDLLHAITDANGNVYTYDYTVLGSGNGINKKVLLTKVTYPDNTPSDPNDNPFKSYTYSGSYPYNLLSVTDENDKVSASWTYDSENRAISSVHANGVDNTTIDYTNIDDPTDPRVTVTNSLGKQSVYHYTTINGRRLVTTIDGLASANCPASNRSTTYDANGNPDVVTDWEGNVTDYDYDLNTNLEVQRIEGVGSPEERKIVTQWDNVLRLPLQIDVYDVNQVNIKRVTFTYDVNGNLLTKSDIDF